MTEQELIKRAIESAKCRIYRVRANVGESLAHQVKVDNQAEIMQVTIDALEKQIAKKPKKQEYKILLDEGWEYACPSCGAAIGVNKKDTLDLTQHETYCPECGQKLLWD